ncbi:MAG: hypothetical protein ACRECD_04430 [Burkholderiaceae bacterium]
MSVPNRVNPAPLLKNPAAARVQLPDLGSLHHFVAKAEWSDEKMLRRVRQWVARQAG